jgi:ubiquinone/menaquinone biosynthesis C-methylase UbiE
MRTNEETAQAVFAARATHYVTSAAHADPETLARMVEAARPHAGWRALDVATGTGHTAFAFAPRVAAIIGTDLTAEMLRHARVERDRLGLWNVAFAQADAHALPFADGSFDLAMSRRAPHHFSDIHRAIAEFRRVLRRGRRLVIDDRSVPEDDFVDRCMNELDTCHDRSHVRQYRPSEWRAMLERGGFRLNSEDLYTKHRPLDSLTKDVCAEDLRAIERVLGGLTEAEAHALRYEIVDGVPHINHWYVLIVAEAA